MLNVTNLEHICEVNTNPLRIKQEEDGEKPGLKRQALQLIPLGINRNLVKEQREVTSGNTMYIVLYLTENITFCFISDLPFLLY